MININELTQIQEIVEEFFQKMTITVLHIELKPSSINSIKNQDDVKGIEEKEVLEDMVNVGIKINEPQMLIGQNGQTLSEIERMLRILLNKNLQKRFYINLDINEYKKKKIEYLKELANSAAGEVVLTKEKKVLPPMSAYERRIIHEALANRQDVVTESHGNGVERCVMISPR